MRVVHIADGALSAAPYRLMQVQRQCGLDARLINESHTFGPRVYPRDRLMTDDPELLRRDLTRADVVHFHNWWRESHLFELHPWARALVAKKPSVIQFHSPRLAQFEPALREPSLIKLVVAQYHVRLYPECEPVPNAVPIDDPLHRPVARRRATANATPIIAFTPPECHDAPGWGNKGCWPTRDILNRGFRHRFVTDTPWREVMQTRRRCDIGIDEVVTGSYHMCSLETLSQGLVAVANLDAQTVDALEHVTGTREHPWVVADLDTLEERLRRLVSDTDELAARRRDARAYMERFWRPDRVADIFRRIYERARERSAA